MVQVGAFPINPPHHQVSTREAYVVTDAVSSSQCKLEKGSMDDSIVVAQWRSKHRIQLSGVSVELIAETLQKWTTTYKEDKGHVVAYMKLHQGQKYGDFYLTQSGLMARMRGGSTEDHCF